MGKGVAGGMTGVGRGIGGAMTGGNPMIRPTVTPSGVAVLPPQMGPGPNIPLGDYDGSFNPGAEGLAQAEAMNPPPVVPPQPTPPPPPYGMDKFAQNGPGASPLSPAVEFLRSNPESLNLPTSMYNSQNPVPPRSVTSQPISPPPMHTGPAPAPQIPQSTNPMEFGPSGGMPTRSPNRVMPAPPPMPARAPGNPFARPGPAPMPTPRPPIGQGGPVSPPPNAPELPQPMMDKTPIHGIFSHAGGPGRENPMTGMRGPSAAAPFNTASAPPAPAGNRGTPPAPTNAPDPQGTYTNASNAAKTDVAEWYNSLPASDQRLVKEVMLHEAQNQGPTGMAAIAEVIKNRSLGTGRSVRSIVTQPHQFTGYKPGGQNWSAAQLANAGGAVGLPTGLSGQTHYYNPKLASPNWGPKMQNVNSVGAHRFGWFDPANDPYR